jgi:hypothetical protein
MNLMQDVAREQIVAPDKDWWRGAVIYQIYPRSFQDSNHDGIGDLAGIIHRLHHVADWAWTRSGSAPSSARPCSISATTSAITATSIRCSARWAISTR